MTVTDPKYDKEIARVIAFLTAAISNMRLYNADHPQVARYLNRAFNALEQVLTSSGDITIIIVEGELSGFETIVADFITQMANHGNPLQMLADLKRWDEYTFTHAINVCLLTMAQAEALGISGKKLHDIGIAAAMHDAGKMFVPDEVLNKSGKLSEEEWRQMRIHTIRGAMHVLRMEGIPKLAFIGALEHHIRYDGSGYPALGHYRPTLVSQMIAIADMFDAMRNRRPYQEPKPVSLIISILKKDSGTAFHPLLVENFLKLIEPTLSE